MSHDDANSVTHWIKNLGTSKHDDATRLLWERYFAKIAGMADHWLRDVAPGQADGEDVALSVFDSFFQGAVAGRFDRLESREDLERLLMTIAVRKSCNKRRDELRQKRGGGLVRTITESEDGDLLSQIAGEEPTPEVIASLADETRKLFEILADDSLRDVVRMKLVGHSNGEIAQALDCGQRTVERKLEVIRKRWLAEGST